MQYGYISSRTDAIDSITHAMKKHCLSKKTDDSQTLTNDTPKKVATKLVNYAFRHLAVRETGEVHCNQCNTQLLPSNHAKIEAFSERCVKIIQHTVYAIGCILTTASPRISTTQKAYIYCYPDMALDKYRFETLKDRLFNCHLRTEEKTSEEKRDEITMINNTINHHRLFYQESTINGNIVHKYGCIKCGIIIDDRLAEQLFYELVPNGRYIGNYLNKCSPKCHPFDHRILVEDSPYSVDGFHRLVPGLVTWNVDATERRHNNTIAGHSFEPDNTLIDSLFDRNFNQSALPDLLKLKFKHIFRAQFHSKNAEEKEEILARPRDTPFSEDMSALFLEIQETGAIPEIYIPAAATPKSSLCITPACNQANTKAIIAFSPCGHVLLCNACWRTNLSILKDSRCAKRNCSRQIQDYISLENHKNYDLDGNELIDKDAQHKTCVKCNRFLTQDKPLYLHFSKRPSLEEGATASPSSFDEALDETKGACALPLSEDKSDHVQKEMAAQHPLCERCGLLSLDKIEGEAFLKGTCPAWQQCGFSESEKATYIRILT